MQILSISPDVASVGQKVTLTGMGFGAGQGDSTLTFSHADEAAVVTEWSDTSIVVPVPKGAKSGPVLVTVDGHAWSVHLGVGGQ